MKVFPLALGLVAAITLPAHASDTPSEANMPVEAEIEPTSAQDTIALNFEPPSSEPTATKATPQPQTAATASSASKDDWYADGSKSVVARVVGAAEGTRNPDGSETEIHDGHVDPGNGVWNRGTFSYQFGNEENLSAEEADRRQMAKIRRIHESVMMPKAEQQGVAPLTVAEELNGIDLINQAPLAVTEAGGYIERLAEAKKKGLSGEEAILEARVWSFWDESKGGWDAPGLRAYDDMGKEASIRHDQQRRMGMIDEALTHYQQQHGTVAQRSQLTPRSEKVASVTATPSSGTAEKTADLIIFGAPQSEAQVAIAR